MPVYNLENYNLIQTKMEEKFNFIRTLNMINFIYLDSRPRPDVEFFESTGVLPFSKNVNEVENWM